MSSRSVRPHRPSTTAVRPPGRVVAIAFFFLCAATFCRLIYGQSNPAAPAEPATWGGDHVGQEFPQYITGDECLFCHRGIGPQWNVNRHQLTVRPVQPSDGVIETLAESAGQQVAEQIQLVMGGEHAIRFLKRSEAYGKLDILTAYAIPDAGRSGTIRIKDDGGTHWDSAQFGDRCAGCHATAVDTNTRSFSAVSLDCVVCHGAVSLEHTRDPSRVLLSSQQQVARQVISICGQCHLRGGRSKSSGLPYPNTFVAGDNLFRDFDVDWSDTALEGVAQIERHIYLNSREVALNGGSAITCLSCHDVHAQSTERHQALGESALCAECHVAAPGLGELRSDLGRAPGGGRHSPTCDY